jgi:hypothetical protein
MFKFFRRLVECLGLADICFDANTLSPRRQVEDADYHGNGGIVKDNVRPTLQLYHIIISAGR